MSHATHTAGVPDIEDIYPLSPMQEGLLFHSLLDPAACLYVGQVAWQLEGALNLAALREAWATLIARHTILRTAFVWDGLDRPLQVVGCRADLPFHVEDFRGLSADEQQRRAALFLEEDRRRPFTLSAAPLLRLAVLRLTDTRQYFVWTQHHLLLDGWSATILMREAMHCYEAVCRGEGVRLSPAEPFGRYIGWLSAQDPDAAEAYWRAALRGAEPSVLQTGTSVSPDTPRARGSCRFSMSRAVAQAAVALARARGLTLNTLVQGTWALWLAHYTGRRDVMFGTTVSGRGAPLPGIDDMVGLFVNTLPVRARIDDERGAAAWLAAFQRDQADARRFEQTPLASIQRWSDSPGGAAHTLERLFDTLLSFHNFHIDLKLPGAGGAADVEAGGALRVIETTTFENPHYTLSVVAAMGDELTFVATYDRNRLSPAIADRMMRHFQHLFERVITAPDTPMGELSPLSGEEARELIAGSRGPIRDYGARTSLYDAIAEQIRRTPDRIAVAAEGGSLTYAALDARASEVAGELASRGAGPERLVGVCLERGAEMVVALLAILKAGAAYVPLDPEHPDDRLARILQDANAVATVTTSALRGRLPAAAATVCVEEPSGGARPAAHRQPATADGLAYVIYTSGSTGTPKGAMNTHAGILNRLHWMQEAHGLRPDDRVLQKTPFTFDVSVWEFFWPLIAGATIVMLPPGAHRDPREVVRAIVAEGITTMHFVPAMLREFLTEPDVERCTSLRRVICSGEALDKTLADDLAGRVPCEVHNLYGPTEAAVDVTWCRWDRRPAGAVEQTVGPTVPIGVPIANLETYVLDGAMRLVPVGVAGELHLGGIGLGRGYLHRPDATAEKFVPHPFSTEPGARLYRTGDLVRRLEDGNLEFLRRIDHQVKIRGNRIELGEIESVLNGLDGVEQSAVLALDGSGDGSSSGGERWLAAYIVPRSADAPPAPAALRDGLERKLPAYMTPRAFVILPRLPLNASGKVDRRALPMPARDEISRAPGYEAPRGQVEELVAAAWEQVLKRRPIGRTDNFFDLGGHSLLATQAMSRVRGTFQIDLPLRTLFEAPTVSALAQRVEQERRHASGTNVPPLVRADRGGDDDLPLSFAQQRLWFLDQLEPGSAAYNLPFGWRLTGPLDRDALIRGFDEIVRRHEILRTVFPERDGLPTQKILPELHVSLDEEDLRGLDDDSRERAALDRAQTQAEEPFDLRNGPLLRVALLRLKDDEHALLLTLHHLVSDGWSMSILAREIGALYEAIERAALPPLAPPAIQYADFAVWQRGWLRDGALQAQLDYWTRQLTGAPPLNLPLLQPRSASVGDRGGVVQFALERDVSAGFMRTLRREGVTLFMGMLACWQLVLSRYTGQHDILVATGIANRTSEALEGLIGFFVNTLVLRTGVHPGQTFRQLLARVRETVLQAYEHQDVPFEKVVMELAPERWLGSSPLFQVMLVLQNAPNEPLAKTPGGLLIVPAFQPAPAAKQDLTLYVWEEDGVIAGSAIYKADLIAESTATHLIDGLRHAIEAISGDSETGVSDTIDIAEIPMGPRREIDAAIADFTSELDRAEA